MRSHLIFAYGILILWLAPTALLLVVAFYPQADSDISDQFSLSINKNGNLQAGDVQLGHTANSSSGQELTVRFDQPKPYPQDVSIQLPFPVVLSADSVHFTSIQGTLGMSWNQTTPWSVNLHLPTLVPEAHTVAMLSFPGHSFTSSIPSLFVSRLRYSSPFLDFSLSLLAFIALAVSAFALMNHRARRHVGTITEPPACLTPSEFGIVVHDGLQPSDLGALFLSLAQRGAFDVVLHYKEIILLRHDSVLSFSLAELGLLDLLFKGKLQITNLRLAMRKLQGTIFSEKVGTVFKAAYGELITNGYYQESPQKTHLRVKTIAIIIQFSGIGGALYSFFYLEPQPFVLFFLLSLIQYGAGLLFYRLSSRLAVLTPTGITVKDEATAFSRYLASTSVQSTFQNEGVFFTYLPYAVAAGQLKKWSVLFSNKSIAIPSWLIVEDEEILGSSLFAAYSIDVAQLLSRTMADLKDPNVG